MRLVLDSNEFLFALGFPRRPHCVQLLDDLMARGEHAIRVDRRIVHEVCRNLLPQAHGSFYGVLDVVMEEGCNVDEEFLVPEGWWARYRDLGFKEGDAHIAAYAEVIEADALVSENRRHFHAMARHLPFRVMDAEQFLKRHATGR